MILLEYFTTYKAEVVIDKSVQHILGVFGRPLKYDGDINGMSLWVTLTDDGRNAVNRMHEHGI